MKGFALVLVLLPFAASAATITVNTTADDTAAADGKCTLREAIANVNAAADTTNGDCVGGTGGGDTIVFNLPSPSTIGLRLGHLQIQKDVTITGPTQGRLSIDARGGDRGMELLTGTLNMSNLTIMHVSAPYGVYRKGFVEGCPDFFECHSALYAAPGTGLVLTNCTFAGNSFYDPAALTIADANAVLDHCTFTRNSSRFYSGAAVHVTGAGTATLTDCMFKGNSGGYYGAMAVEEQGTATLTDCTFIRNRSWSQGGAFYGGGGGTVFTNCTFRGNTAYDSGGAISAGNVTVINSLITRNTAGYTGGGIDGSATVINSTLSRNTAGWGLVPFGLARGGGAVAAGGVISLTNCTLYDNRARASGGAVLNPGGIVTLSNCTLSGNRAFNYSWEPAGHAIDTGYTTTTVTNTIIAGVPSHPNCGGVTSGGHNLSSDNTCFAPGGSDLLNTPPYLARPANYGGMTPTLALCTGPRTPDASCVAASPAIDAGDDAVTGPPDNLTTDQRGLPRFSGAHVDIGAYEVQ